MGMAHVGVSLTNQLDGTAAARGQNCLERTCNCGPLAELLVVKIWIEYYIFTAFRNQALSPENALQNTTPNAIWIALSFN